MYISIGTEFKVVLEGTQSFLDEIVTEVSGGRLTVKMDNWRFNQNEKVTCIYHNA